MRIRPFRGHFSKLSFVGLLRWFYLDLCQETALFAAAVAVALAVVSTPRFVLLAVAFAHRRSCIITERLIM